MGYLDSAGLSHFTAWVKARLSGKQDALTPDGSIKLQGGDIAVSLPTKAVSKAEYEAMTEEQKQAEAVYLVDEPPWTPAPLSIQEYDTEDGWHVRKWSDGYIEMDLRTSYSAEFSSSTGGFLRGDAGSFSYPVKLTSLYSISAGTGEGRTGGALSMFFGWMGQGVELVSTPHLYAVATDNDSQPFKLFVHVTGRWK